MISLNSEGPHGCILLHSEMLLRRWGVPIKMYPHIPIFTLLVTEGGGSSGLAAGPGRCSDPLLPDKLNNCENLVYNKHFWIIQIFFKHFHFLKLKILFVLSIPGKVSPSIYKIFLLNKMFLLFKIFSSILCGIAEARRSQIEIIEVLFRILSGI